MAAGPEGQEGAMLEYSISALADQPPAVVTIGVVSSIPLL